MARQEFSKPVRREAHKRSGGICECYRIKGVPGLTPGGCGQRLSAGNTFYEHVDPDGAGGRPVLDNCAVLVKTCWRIKTDHYDRPVVAKVIRQHDRDIGIGRRTSAPIPGSRNTPFHKHVDGRTTFRPGFERRP